jgi:hypothetical protein
LELTRAGLLEAGAFVFTAAALESNLANYSDAEHDWIERVLRSLFAHLFIRFCDAVKMTPSR